MAQISLVLPFALPPPDIAADLVRELRAPALSALLSKTASAARVADDGDARTLPHERWLARALGLERDGRPAFASAAMRGFGLEPGDGRWMILHPSHIEIARNHLMLHDLRRLRLADAHARALCEAARPYIEELGLGLAYGDAHTWFLRADAWTDFETATPDAAAGLDISHFMPKGEHAVRFRKLQNEIQMLWFEHPVNLERERRGLAPVNGLWPWSGPGGAPSMPLHADAPTLAGIAATTPIAQLLNAPPAHALLVADALSAPVIGADWRGWLLAMEQLEQDCFAPLHAALGQGRIAQLRLILSGRDALADITTTPLAQRKFWRRATLNALLP